MPVPESQRQPVQGWYTSPGGRDTRKGRHPRAATSVPEEPPLWEALGVLFSVFSRKCLAAGSDGELRRLCTARSLSESILPQPPFYRRTNRAPRRGAPRRWNSKLVAESSRWQSREESQDSCGPNLLPPSCCQLGDWFPVFTGEVKKIKIKP